MQKIKMILIFFFQNIQRLFFDMNYIYGAPFHISTTSGDVKQLKGKPIILFQSKHLTVTHTFYVFKPLY